MDEIILTGVCTERGVSPHNKLEEVKFAHANLGHRVVITIKTEESYPEKERLYAYYFGPFLSVATDAFTNAGYEGMDKVSTDYKLSAMFLKGFIKLPDGEREATILSKRKITKERLLKYVQDCIFFLESELNTQAPDSMEYKTFKLSGRKLRNTK